MKWKHSFNSILLIGDGISSVEDMNTRLFLCIFPMIKIREKIFDKMNSFHSYYYCPNCRRTFVSYSPASIGMENCKFCSMCVHPFEVVSSNDVYFICENINRNTATNDESFCSWTSAQQQCINCKCICEI